MVAGRRYNSLMDVYPLDLILTVAIASATIFLGFLPTKDIRFPFFARESLKAAVAWVAAAVVSPPTILHFPVIFAILCLMAWKNFQRDNGYSGKWWLYLASGLGISVGVVFVLAVTPPAFPPGLSPMEQFLLLASIYLGGAVIGLAYVCWVLTQRARTNPGITRALVQRYLNLLVFLVTVRAAVLLADLVLPGSVASHLVMGVNGIRNDHTPVNLSVSALALDQLMMFPMLVLIILALFARRMKASPLLPAICLVGLATESLARLLML